MHEIQVSDFSPTILQDHAITIIDFYGDGCAPCRQIIPLLEWAEKTYPQLRIYKVNISNSQGAFDNLYIRAVPTVIFFWQGKEVERVVGTVTKISFINHIENALKSAGV